MEESVMQGSDDYRGLLTGGGDHDSRNVGG